MPETFTGDALRVATFLVEALVLLFVGKLVRDGWALLRGYKVNELRFVQDHVAAAIDLSGYMLGLIIGLLGAVVVSSESWLGQASDIAISGLCVIGCMLLGDWIADRAVFRGIDDHEEILANNNIALSIGRAGAAVATGFVISGALGHTEAPLLYALIWFGVGQAAMVIIALVYQWITPYDDLKEIKNGNIAAALPIAGILIAVGITVEAAVYGEVTSFTEDLLSVLLYLGVSIVLVWLLRWLTDVFLLPGARLTKEIAEDKNAGAGLIEGTSFVLGALLVAFFLG